MGLVTTVLDSVELFLVWEPLNIPFVFHVKSTGELKEQTDIWRHFSYFVAFNCSALLMLWVPATFVALFNCEVSNNIISFTIFYLVTRK